MSLPEKLLHQISQLDSGRVVLVVGAGCSAEPPTNLPLSAELAVEAHRRLVEDGVLSEGDCPDPNNLSCLADAVWSKTGSQTALIIRFPCERFRQATPNEGHLLAAAMLNEQALSCVMTINFDLALSNALSHIGGHGSVSVISKPEEYLNFGPSNLVYLHRNVEQPPDSWVLRSITLDQDWKIGWEKIITEKVISAPVTVFVGLGSPVGILEESTSRILDKLKDIVNVYQVDPAPMNDSSLFKKLGLPKDTYLQMGWVQFMRELAIRLVREHRADLDRACWDLIKDEGWEVEDVDGLCQRITGQGLLKFGQIRARWTLALELYVPRRKVTTEWLADLLLAIGLIERVTSSLASFRIDGIVEFRRDNLTIGALILAHGHGYMRMAAIEARIKQSRQYREQNDPGTISAIVAGVSIPRDQQLTPPESIILQGDESSLIPPEESLKIYTVDELRERSDLAMEILS